MAGGSLAVSMFEECGRSKEVSGSVSEASPRLEHVRGEVVWHLALPHPAHRNRAAADEHLVHGVTRHLPLDLHLLRATRERARVRGKDRGPPARAPPLASKVQSACRKVPGKVEERSRKGLASKVQSACASSPARRWW